MGCKGAGHVVALVQIFQNYASQDADKDHLSKSELKDLLQKEFPGLLSDAAKPEEVNKIMGVLDNDQDGQVDITEYFVTLCSLGILMFESCKGGKGGAGCPKK